MARAQARSGNCDYCFQWDYKEKPYIANVMAELCRRLEVATAASLGWHPPLVYISFMLPFYDTERNTVDEGVDKEIYEVVLGNWISWIESRADELKLKEKVSGLLDKFKEPLGKPRGIREVQRSFNWHFQGNNHQSLAFDEHTKNPPASAVCTVCDFADTWEF